MRYGSREVGGGGGVGEVALLEINLPLYVAEELTEIILSLEQIVISQAVLSEVHDQTTHLFPFVILSNETVFCVQSLFDKFD